MNPRYVLGMALAGAAILAIPTTALAQFPPSPPATFYGSVPGAAAAQGVVAIVINNGNSTVCGSGTVINDASGPVYVIDVVSDAQIPGCGVPGRTVQFYFTPAGTNSGRLSVETTTWNGAGPQQQNLTLGPQLTTHYTSTMVASDRPAS